MLETVEGKATSQIVSEGSGHVTTGGAGLEYLVEALGFGVDEE
jgi:hypothetical protein